MSQQKQGIIKTNKLTKSLKDKTNSLEILSTMCIKIKYYRFYIWYDSLCWPVLYKKYAPQRD